MRGPGPARSPEKQPAHHARLRHPFGGRRLASGAGFENPGVATPRPAAGRHHRERKKAYVARGGELGIAMLLEWPRASNHKCH